VEELLEAAPDLKAMVTSRTVLQVRGEQEYSVPPLVLPDPAHLPDLAALSQYEAVKLFIDRAMAVKPDFGIDRRNAPAVAEICARLDGLPLAIELAASRAKLLSPQDMLPRLERRLSLLTSGARGLPERQRTLRGAIAWSHDLLDEAERRLFARISTFMGGCTIEATEAVCDPGDLGVDVFEGLASLVDKSLLRQTGTPGGGSRFVMLETIREFAVEQLEAQGDAAVVRRRHGEHFLALAREAEPHLETDEQKPWLDRCDLEHGNIRAALRWALDAGEVEAGQESAGALWRFWQQRGHLAEARRWFDELLAAPGGQDRTPARGKALTGAGGIAYWQNDYPAAWAHYGEAVELYRDLGDRPRLANALYNMGFQPAVDHRYEEAAPYFEEAVHIAREEGLTETQAAAQSMLGYIEMWRRNYDAALPLVEETVEIHRRTGNRFKVADDLTGLALLYHLTGRTDEARQALRESLGMFRDVENPTGMGLALHGFASLAAAEGRHEDAALLSGASAKLKEMVGGGAPPELTSNYGDPVSEAKEHLDEETFQRAWQEGYSMPVDKAVAHALE
jgi:predicted ATPase